MWPTCASTVPAQCCPSAAPGSQPLPLTGPQEKQLLQSLVCSRPSPELRGTGTLPYKASRTENHIKVGPWGVLAQARDFPLCRWDFILLNSVPPQKAPAGPCQSFCSLRGNRCGCHTFSKQTLGAHRTQYHVDSGMHRTDTFQKRGHSPGHPGPSDPGSLS